MKTTRAGYQDGSLTREARKHGPAVWIFRWRDESRARRKVIVGTVTEFPTKALAKQAVESQGLRSNINREASRKPCTWPNWLSIPKEELPDESSKAYSTRAGYESYLKNWIVPAWGDRPLSDVRTVGVEEWLGTLSLTNGSKAKSETL